MKTLLKDCLSQLARAGLTTSVLIRRDDIQGDGWHLFEDLVKNKEINVNEYEVLSISQSQMDLAYYIRVIKVKEK